MTTWCHHYPPSLSFLRMRMDSVSNESLKCPHSLRTPRVISSACDSPCCAGKAAPPRSFPKAAAPSDTKGPHRLWSVMTPYRTYVI